MSKLIGTNPNQVPSNADLGSAAFKDVKDFLTARGSSLSAIGAIIPKTARDVFVYDTSLDSDGGAWRKRTQHTSWYNEKLNTSTRGSRREFPAVAVIVVELHKLTIYDADDSSMPMWMVFETGQPASSSSASGKGTVLNWYSSAQNYVNCATQLNSKLVVGTPGAVMIFDFMADDTRISYNSNNWEIFPKTISSRNGYDTVKTGGNGYNIVGLDVNDVDITVLPTAPIDSATGLPVPTIAIATDEGVSIIKDNDSVVDISITSTYNGAGDITFLPDNRIAFSAQQSSASTAYYRYCICPIPNSDVTGQAYWQSYSDDVVKDYAYGNYTSGVVVLHPTNTSVSGNIYAVESTKSHKAIGGVGTLTLLEEDSNIAKTNNMVAFIKNDHNTGWMPGDIELATLSDIDAVINSREFIKNGDFSNGTSNWLTTSGASITESGGVATVTSSGTAIWSGAYQGVTGLEVGKTYIATADIITSNNWGSFSFSNGGGSAVKYGSYTSWNAGSSFPIKARAYFVATSTVAVLTIDSLNTSSATVTQIDNITVREAVVDRSNQAKPLQVYGTINKTPVAPGAELVAYSGFTSGEYSGVRLEQPPNTNLNPGSGDYSISFWLRDVGAGCDVMGLGRRGTDLSWNIYHDAGGGLRLTVSYNGTTYQSIVEIQFGGAIDRWTHVVYTKVGDLYSAYLNGEYYTSNKGTSDTLYTTSRAFMIGSGHTNNNIVGDPKYALLKLSKTAPTPDQIKKMYEDEKALFQENAKATLYGNSNTITSLSYDDSTDLLHAGTSAGRSVFQGLRRVDNTTDAVDTAISAVNGMVVEE